MTRVLASIALAACLAIAACGEDPIEPSTNLVGIWTMEPQDTPGIYGLVTAQVIFGDDSSFQFIGHNPLSSGPAAGFVVSGTWSRTETTVTLVTGHDSQTWNLDFRVGHVRFTHPVTGYTFRLFAPLPE